MGIANEKVFCLCRLPLMGGDITLSLVVSKMNVKYDFHSCNVLRSARPSTLKV